MSGRAHAPDWRPAATCSASVGIRPLVFIPFQSARRSKAASARRLLGLFLCLQRRKVKTKTCPSYCVVFFSDNSHHRRSAGTPGGKTNKKKKINCRQLCVWWTMFFIRFVFVLVVLVVLNSDWLIWWFCFIFGSTSLEWGAASHPLWIYIFWIMSVWPSGFLFFFLLKHQTD